MIAPADLAARFEELLDKLGGDASAGLAKAYAAWQSGLINTDTFAQLVADGLATINALARGSADVFATAAVNTRFGMELVPLGEYENADKDVQRIGKAATTLAGLLDTADDMPMRLDRLGRNEAHHTAQQQVIDTYRRHRVTGYRRHTDSQPCELCVWLVKAHLDPEGIGYIYPTTKPMHRHTGCKCTPIPAERKSA